MVYFHCDSLLPHPVVIISGLRLIYIFKELTVKHWKDAMEILKHFSKTAKVYEIRHTYPNISKTPLKNSISKINNYENNIYDK